MGNAALSLGGDLVTANSSVGVVALALVSPREVTAPNGAILSPSRKSRPTTLREQSGSRMARPGRIVRASDPTHCRHHLKRFAEGDT